MSQPWKVQSIVAVLYCDSSALASKVQELVEQMHFSVECRGQKMEKSNCTPISYVTYYSKKTASAHNVRQESIKLLKKRTELNTVADFTPLLDEANVC